MNRRQLFGSATGLALAAQMPATPAGAQDRAPNVIFFHPDGFGANH